LNDVGVSHHEWVVVVAVRVVGLVDKVPAGLEAVTLGLDVIGKGSALGHWMIFLVTGEGRVVLLEGSELSKHCFVSIVVLRLEQVLAASRYEEVSSAPEGLN